MVVCVSLYYGMPDVFLSVRVVFERTRTAGRRTPREGSVLTGVAYLYCSVLYVQIKCLWNFKNSID